MVSEKMTDDRVVKIFEMPKLVLGDVLNAYVGKPNKCRCGCSGKYFVPKVNEEKADKERGYAQPDDVNDKAVQRVINKMTKNASKGVELQDGYIYTQVVGQTEYSIYRVRE